MQKIAMKIIKEYFPNLSAEQEAQFEKLDALYREWNEKINVISRKDIDNLYTNHVLHSLALGKVNPAGFVPGTKILDIGTGGGFPGIPLAILYPEVEFELVDSIRKKITVVTEVANGLGLKNVKGTWSRAEELKSQYDFVVTRAVAPLAEVYSWCRNKISKKERNAIPNGLFAWKGDSIIKEELKEMPKGGYSEIHPMKEFYTGEDCEFFDTKIVVYYQPA